ncbi:MAG: hypothetical protein KDC90_17620, partial [Ignavibacteriae bacterium]|nr:hypothetical protein [Ignavibacteriota bacterium]
LSTKLSKEDSLVLVSALLPEPSKPEKIIHLVSKDEQFASSVNDTNLTAIYTDHSLSSPDVDWINKIELESGTWVNLTNKQDDARLDAFLPAKVSELIKTKNTELYLGRTFTPGGNGFPANALCFKIDLNKKLPRNIFITIISKDLTFIYSSKHSIPEFWQNGSAIPDNFSTNEEAQTNISFLITDENEINLSAEIMGRLREEGNLVFIHPDSNV